MIDIHTHILYGIDDGPKTKEESLEILKQAQTYGVTDIVLTPHYIKNSKYNTNNQEKTKLLEELQKHLKENNININLYLGNEIYITENITSLHEEISTINNTKYILIEFPQYNKVINLDEILYELKENNLIPIIAHPERYLSYYKDYDFFKKLIKKGCLFQGNIDSIYGKNGLKAKKMIKKMLKDDMIHFLATDIHSKNNNIYKKNIKKDILKIVKDKNKIDDLLINNPNKILKNKDIDM